MEIEYVYPSQTIRERMWEKVRRVLKWCFCVIAYASPVVNLCVGGKAWSVIVLWSLWFIWSMLLSPSLIERNRISQAAKVLINTCVLLIIIDTVSSYGWSAFVIPIIGFGALVIIGVLFLSDITKQRQNMMPMIWLILASFAAIICSLIGWPRMSWPMIVLGATALALLAVCVVVLRRDLLLELRKRFHTE
jgi:hypothetical protein